MRPLYFIASYPRSGNTWVRAFIQALLRQSGQLPERLGALKNIDELLPWDIRTRYVEPLLGKPVVGATLPELARVRGLVHTWFGEQFKGPPIIKTHALYGTMHGYQTIPSRGFMGACYLVRNPLDVAPSLARLMDYSLERAVATMTTPNYVTGAHKGAAPEPWGDWSYNVHSWTEVGPGNVLTLRYEDIRANPMEQFLKVSQHMRFGASPSSIQRAVEAVALDRLEASERSGNFQSPAKDAKKFFGSGTRQSYREKLTPAEARTIIEAHAVRMDKFGYLDAEALEFAGLSREQALAAGRAFRP